MTNEREHERIAEGVKSGALIHLLNNPRSPFERVLAEDQNRARGGRQAFEWRNRGNEEIVSTLEKGDYGEGEVIVSVAIDETGNTHSQPGDIGFYVTAAAFELFHQKRQAEFEASQQAQQEQPSTPPQS